MRHLVPLRVTEVRSNHTKTKLEVSRKRRGPMNGGNPSEFCDAAMHQVQQLFQTTATNHKHFQQPKALTEVLINNMNEHVD